MLREEGDRMTFFEYLARRWEHLLELTIEHALVTLLSVAIATVIGVALGLATYRTERPREMSVAVTAVFLTIPSLALFGLFVQVPFLGLGWRSVVVALVMYALLPIVRNTIVGLREVDSAIVESAQGMGMGRYHRLLRIELPLAWPVIMTGVRISAQMLMGIAAIAAFALGPGLGGYIFSGISRMGGANATNSIIVATVGILLLAVILDAVLNLVTRLTTPRGIRV